MIAADRLLISAGHSGERHLAMAAALADAVPNAERTLLVELLSRSFVLEFEAASSTGNLFAIVDWVGRMCRAHADTPAVATLFREACRALEAHLARKGDRLQARRDLCVVDRHLQRIAAGSEGVATQPSDQLDETDAAIHASLTRLGYIDPLTAEHSRAVGMWCGRLARKLSLSDAEITYASRCGAIHDIGKTTTPTDILNAPRALTQDEWVVMRDHASAGEALVRQEPLLAAFSPAVRSHHERLDGKGYPDKIGGDEVPLFTRIVTVADCFNAMIGRRPYRLPMSPATALEQLTIHSGKQFDETVVAAMRDILR